MIDIAKLTPDDVGRWVCYYPKNGIGEVGKIKGWNKTFIFVVYTCNGEWDNFKDYTGNSTQPNDLKFTKISSE